MSSIRTSALIQVRYLVSRLANTRLILNLTLNTDYWKGGLSEEVRNSSSGRRAVSLQSLFHDSTTMFHRPYTVTIPIGSTLLIS